MPKLYGDGYLLVGDAAGLSLNALTTVRGMDFAIASGYYAGRAAVEATGRKDFSAASLARYEELMRSSFVLKDLETARHIPRVMENPRLFRHYPAALSGLLEEIFTVGPKPTRRLAKIARTRIVKDFVNLATLRDSGLCARSVWRRASISRPSLA